MRPLPQNFDHIVVAIEESRDLEKLKIEDLQSSIEVHEMRMRERNPIKPDEQALKVQHYKGDEKKHFKKWKGKSGKGKWRKESSSVDEPDERSDSVEKKSKFEKSSKKKDKRNIECFNCHKFGHFAYDCFSGKRKQKKKFQSKETHLAHEESDSEPLTLMVMTTTDFMELLTKNWYLNLGCSNHMTYNMVNFDDTNKTRGKLVGNNTLMIEGMGDIIIKRKNG